MIIIDGSQSEKSISAFANLEELLKDVMQDDQMTNRVVTDVLVNNEAFSEIYPHQAEDIACSEISSIEVRSVPMAEMAVDMSAELGKVAQMMAHGSREVARLFRAASDTDALELFQDLLDVTEKFSSLLSEMGDVLENEDWILLADLLEYEFIPLCDDWRATSEILHKQVAEHMAQ